MAAVTSTLTDSTLTDWWRLVGELAKKGFYGTLTLTFRDGKITGAVKQETIVQP